MTVTSKKPKPGERFLGGSGVIIFRKPPKKPPVESTDKDPSKTNPSRDEKPKV